MKRFLLILFVLLPMMLSAQNLVPVRHTNGKWGFKESEYSEKFVIKPKFENAHPFVGDYAFVCKKGLWGIIGKDGKFIAAPTYNYASQPYSGITIVQLGSKYGLIKDSKEFLRIEYESIEHLKTGAFRLKKDGRVGLSDASGKIFLPVEYQDIAIYNNGYKLKANNLFGLADVSGKIFLPVEYEDIANCGNGYKLQANGRVGLADANGKILLPVEYEDIADYGNGYKLKANGCVGLADASGKIVLEAKHKGVLYLQNNTFAVYSNKLEFVNSEGKVVGQPNNVLLYTSNNGKTIDRGGRIGKIVSNTYHNGQGIMVFDKPITSIGNSAFSGCSGLTSITIPNSVTEIGTMAFYGCDRLTSVTIGNSVTSIGYGAFYECKSLTSITIPSSVTTIGDCAFYDCEKLTSITIPNSVTEIGAWAFHNCTGLTSITIPNSVTEIGDYAFHNCDGLTSVTIGNSVTTIGSGAFSDCDGLTRVNVNISDLARYCTSNPMHSIPGKKHLYLNGKEITNLVIPNSVTSIGDWAFYNCTGLTSITIPNSVTEIGEVAFAVCKNLIKANFQGATPPSMGVSAFRFVSGDFKIYIPKGTLDAYESGDWSMDYKYLIVGFKIPKIPANQIITYTTTDGCKISANDEYCAHILSSSKLCLHTYENGVGKLIFKDRITEIVKQAFYGCKNLKSITIPNSVTEIGDYAFYGCENLKSVTIPNSVTSIEYKAFFNCTSLKAVYLNATIPPYLGEDVFDYYGGRICCPIYVPSSSLSKYKGVGGNWWSYYQYLRGR